MKILSIILFTSLSINSFAQVDTLNPNNLKLNIAALKEGKSSYAVFFTDSIGNRLGSADIWDRTITFSKNERNERLYNFDWKWYKKDTLILTTQATGILPNLAPVSHFADYRNRGKFSYSFNKDTVTIPDAYKRNAKDSAFKVIMDPPAFEFPMDLEIFALVPFNKVNQQFAIAFYEPSSPKSNYYKITVTGKEDLSLVGGVKVSCWLLRIEYRANSYATFWITDKTRDVVKMQEYFSGRYRYKVRLY